MIPDQAEFEYTNQSASFEQSSPRITLPSLDAYRDEPLLSDRLSPDSPIIENKQASQGVSQSINPVAPSGISGQDAITFIEGGRWQVVESSPTGDHIVRLSTDDPHEARDAALSYANYGSVQVRIFDAEMGGLAFDDARLGERQSLYVSEAFQCALAAISINPAPTLQDRPVLDALKDGNQNAGSSIGLKASEPELNVKDLSPESGSKGPAKWVSSKNEGLGQMVGLAADGERSLDKELEKENRMRRIGGTVTPPLFGGLFSAVGDGIKRLVSRESSNGGISNGAAEHKFKAGDEDTWRKNSLAREVAALSADMDHSLGAVQRLKQTPYARLANELAASGEKVEGPQKERLEHLRQHPEVGNAINEIRSLVGDVQSRSKRLGDEAVDDKELKSTLKKNLEAWSNSMSDEVKTIPDPKLQIEILEQIRELMRTLMDKLMPSNSKAASPSM